MRLSFRSVSTSIALSFFALALVLMLAPHHLLSRWGLEVSLAVGIMCRRAAALLGGIVLMLFLARNAEPSAARTAMVKGIASACLMLAALGILELAIGQVASGILVAVSIEVAFALALLHVGRSPSEQMRTRI